MDVLQFFKALAHESRLRLVGLLAQREHNVQELAQLVSLKEPTVSHHLSVLKQAGLVRLRADGNTHWYALQTDTLSRAARDVLSSEGLEKFSTPKPVKSHEVRTLENYLTEDGRIKAFPATLKKRRPILAWLARQFEEGRRYKEAEVNAIIERRHHDRETFRRELIAHKMMARESGMYWRLPESEWVL